MKSCKYCNVTVETEKDFCPLCFNKLIDDGNEVEIFYPQNLNEKPAKKPTKFLYKLFLFITLCALAICAVINYLTTPDVLWSVVVGCGLLYVWVLVAHTILSKQSVFKKVLLQILSILLLLFFTEKLSDSLWLFAYVYPSVSLGVIITTLMMLFIKSNRSEYLIGFSFIYLLMDILSILILIFYRNSFYLLNLINVIFCSFAFIGLLIFGFNAMKAEIAKKWHL